MGDLRDTAYIKDQLLLDFLCLTFREPRFNHSAEDMDESQDMFGDGSMVAELMPAAVLGSGTGALLFSGDTIRIPADVSIKKEVNDKTTKSPQKPVRKRPVGESKSASKKRARSESDVDKGDNLHPRPKMSYAQLAALALRASKKNEETVSGHVFKRKDLFNNLSLFRVSLSFMCKDFGRDGS